VLGHGGMASVYRAYDENLGVEVAVKENAFVGEEYSRQFRLEANILATLRHPNLPRVSNHFEIEGQGQYLIMDYIEGEDLRQRIERTGPLASEEVILIGAAICDALAYLHSRQPPVVHRDIKPSNVKIDPDGSIYLVDFGLAKVLKDRSETTGAARALTPGYSSPEQYGSARTDARSDIYSLGATLYAVLTGQVPVDAIERAMGHAELIPLHCQAPKISPRLAEAIEKAMAVKPEDRFQSAEAFKSALLSASTVARRRASAGALTVPPPPGSVVRAIAEELASKTRPLAPAPARRSWTALLRRWLLAALGIVVIFGGVALLMHEMGIAAAPFDALWSSLISSSTPTSTRLTPATTTAPLAAVASATLSPSPSPSVTTTATQPVAATPSPTSSLQSVATVLGGGSGQIAYASERFNRPQIWLVDLDSSESTQLTDLEGGACQPAWSPDGRHLLFVSPCRAGEQVMLDAMIYSMEMDDGEIVPLVPESGRFNPAWSPDGSSVLFIAAYDYLHSQVMRLDLDSGVLHAMTDSDYLYLEPAWSPDGEWIVFVSDRYAGDNLWVMPNQPGATPQLFTRSGGRQNASPAWALDGEQVYFSQQAAGQPAALMRLPFEMLGVAPTDYAEDLVIDDPVLFPVSELAFSPDGAWLAVQSWPGGSNHDIYILRPDGSDRRRLTTYAGLDFNPAWRPVTLAP